MVKLFLRKRQMERVRAKKNLSHWTRKKKKNNVNVGASYENG